jgi:hypothetical protein
LGKPKGMNLNGPFNHFTVKEGGLNEIAVGKAKYSHISIFFGFI